MCSASFLLGGSVKDGVGVWAGPKFGADADDYQRQLRNFLMRVDETGGSSNTSTMSEACL